MNLFVGEANARMLAQLNAHMHEMESGCVRNRSKNKNHK